MSKRIFFLIPCLLILAAGCSRGGVRQELPVMTEPYRVQAPTNITRRQTKLIVIDPGHGGEDRGAQSLSKPKYQEKFLNLSAALMLRDILNHMGYQTLMTRSDDQFIPLLSRAEFANENDPILFVSVHFNSAPSREAKGVEVYFYSSAHDKQRASLSKKLAELVLNQIIAQTHAKSRGAKHGDFAVIRETNMPAILVEGGFLTNEEEMQNIKDPAYLKKLTLGIAQGIDAFVRN